MPQVEYVCVVTLTEDEWRKSLTNGGITVEHPKDAKPSATVIRGIKQDANQ